VGWQRGQVTGCSRLYGVWDPNSRHNPSTNRVPLTVILITAGCLFVRDDVDGGFNVDIVEIREMCGPQAIDHGGSHELSFLHHLPQLQTLALSEPPTSLCLQSAGEEKQNPRPMIAAETNMDAQRSQLAAPRLAARGEREETSPKSRLTYYTRSVSNTIPEHRLPQRNPWLSDIPLPTPERSTPPLVVQ